MTLSSNGEDLLLMKNDEMVTRGVKLSDLEEWEDYEEPKEYWTIDWSCTGVTTYKDSGDDIDEFNKSIGNYFETKDEAEKALEKLKALKILKNNGFRFIQWEFDMKTIADGNIWFDVGVNTQWDAEQLLKHRPEVKESLDLLFGGEDGN